MIYFKFRQKFKILGRYLRTLLILSIIKYYLKIILNEKLLNIF
jgi:hypothetical protein